jgi:DNA-binding SARP family transcriptional activator
VRPAAGERIAANRTILKLLDGFELVCGGRSIALPLSAQRLVAFVGLHRGPLIRSYVAGSLWLDLPEDSADARLCSTLRRLHRQGARVIESNEQHLALASGVVVDLRESEALAQRLLSAAGDDLDVGPSALGGDVLPGWDQDWVAYERERFRQLRLNALDALCERLTDAGRTDLALDAGLAAIASEPLRESSHRAVIRAHLAGGDLAEAIRQYRLCRRLLKEHLGLEPSDRTDALFGGGDTLARAG